VLAYKSGSEFSWGEPGGYLQGVVVEATLTGEFAGPVLRRTTTEGQSVETPERLSRFLVTRIVSSRGGLGAA
jgi:hypothetical protein